MQRESFDRDDRGPQSHTPEPFRLYPVAQAWWSLNDYGAVLRAVQQLRSGPDPNSPLDPTLPFRVLEFGPGSSTLSLIEGGATHIDTCEDDPEWAAVWEERLQGRFPGIVHVHRYDWRDQLTIPAVNAQAYDLALVDGPRDMARRPAAVQYALAHARAVLVPTEEIYPEFRGVLLDLVKQHNLSADIRETGPLQGAFALITRSAVVAPAVVVPAAGSHEHGEKHGTPAPAVPPVVEVSPLAGPVLPLAPTPQPSIDGPTPRQPRKRGPGRA